MLGQRSALPRSMILGLLLMAHTARPVTSQLPEKQWLTVLAVKKGTGGSNIYDLLMSADPQNDASGKESQDPQELVARGNFKSNLTEFWSTVQPSKVRVVLFNKGGYTLWFTDFAGPSRATKDPVQWMAIPSISLSSDSKLTASSRMTIVFDQTKLDIRSADNVDGRLLLTWDSKSLDMFVATSQWQPSPPPLSDQGSVSSNMEMVLAQASTNNTSPFTFSSNLAYWMFPLSTRYLVGVGLRKNVSSPGELTQFLLQVAVDPSCYPDVQKSASLYRTLCHPGTNNPVVFNATYKQGADKSLAVVAFDYTVAAYCLKLIVYKTTGDHQTSVYLYHTEQKSVAASTFGIQWWIEPEPETTTLASSCKVVTLCDGPSSTDVTPKETVDVITMKESDKEKLRDEIQQALTVDKQNTTKFKRQFISMPDHRPSAVALGILGISIISFVIFSIFVLDFHTLSQHLKVMVANCRRSRRTPAKAAEVSSSPEWNLRAPESPSRQISDDREEWRTSHV